MSNSGTLQGYVPLLDDDSRYGAPCHGASIMRCATEQQQDGSHTLQPHAAPLMKARNRQNSHELGTLLNKCLLLAHDAVPAAQSMQPKDTHTTH